MTMFLWAAVAAVVIYLDQVSKWLSVAHLKGEESVDLIPGILRLTYVENRGAAFGMLDDKRWVFLIISTVMLVVIGMYLWSYRKGNPGICISLSLLLGGGIGNMIDRILLGYVVDFIDSCAFPEVWMWVFNLADSAVCVGAALLVLCVISKMIKESRDERAAALERDGKFRRDAD
jgi:signal peptidase II